MKSEMDLSALKEKLVRLQLKLSGLTGQTLELSKQKAALEESISLTKARLEMAPEVTQVFEYLQEKAHQRAVGEFEDLLTAFVQDVVPNAGEVRLELGTERGAPALDVFVDNGGDLEGVLDGNGGGLTNVIVTGLAFSALSRTNNRQLMVLDEPDCWLKSTYVPAFTRVIAQVANPPLEIEESTEEFQVTGSAGIQTLMISHNDVDLMDESAHVKELRIEKDIDVFLKRTGLSLKTKGKEALSAYTYWVPTKTGPGALMVEYREDDAFVDEESNALNKGLPVIDSLSGVKPFKADEAGIRWIEVKNLRHHAFTRIDLSSGLNVISGDINSGKSTLYLTALRALAYGESDDRIIRHGAPSAIVRIGLEGGIELEMERKRRGSPKVTFRRFKDGKLINEGPAEARSRVPDFIAESLNISQVDGLDIQLRSQKQPIFLLNETPSKRARLLSVGKESGLLQTLIENQRSAVRRDRDSLKREETEIAQLNRRLKALSPLSSLEDLIPIMQGMEKESEAISKDIVSLVQLTSAISTESAIINVASGINSSEFELPETPEILDIRELALVIQGLQSTQKIAQLPMPNASPDVLGSEDIELSVQLEALIQDIEVLSKKAQIRVPEESLTLPSLADLGDLQQMGVSLKTLSESIVKLQAESEEISIEEKAATEELVSLRAAIGVCPTCDQSFGDHNHA